MSEKRPRGRKQNITGTGEAVHRDEEGLGTGPVGEKDGYASRKEAGKMPGKASSRPAAPMGQSTGSQSGSSLFGTGGYQQKPSVPVQQPVQQQPVRPQAQSSGLFGAAQQSNMQRPQQSSSLFGAQQSQRPSSSSKPAGQQIPRPSASSSSSQKPAQSSPVSGTGIPIGTSGSNTQKAGSRSGCSPILLVIIAVVLLGGGGLGGLTGLFGGGSTDNSPAAILATQAPAVTAQPANDWSGIGTNSGSSSVSGLPSALTSGFGSLLSGTNSWYNLLGGAAGTSGSTGVRTDSTQLNRSVASGSRDKYVTLMGNGRDTVTLMVYMCGTDLESRSGMATRDIQEMCAASTGSKVNLLLYTGGCASWRNNLISSQVNQIWQVKDGRLVCLDSNRGSSSMTNPSTLSDFLRYGVENFPASRYQLIFWDHGSGSVNGYGYDEKNGRSGSMSLAGINTALKNSGVKFDFIGFDACLMATVENGLMLSKYADYMIAAEESEPGIGWYYTNWLNMLAKDTSTSTLDLGKQICDDFVSACSQQCPGQATTLSVVDLAELENTVPAKLSAFSSSVSGLIKAKEYAAVSNARTTSREFAASSRIDQVDLADLALKMGTEASQPLVTAIRGAVKYNRTGSMTDAYGLSIYFPYQKISNVDKAVNTYAQIGMDDAYAQCIREFASVEASGQAATGGMNHQIPSILSGSSSSSSYGSGDLISSLLGSFLGGGFDSIGLSADTSGFLSGRPMSEEETSAYITANYLDPSALTFRTDNSGQKVLSLSAEQWALVHSIELNTYYDDGKGYIDYGLDTLFDWTDEGNLIANTAGAWISIDNQQAAYYCTSYQDDGETQIITGRVPVLLNGYRAELILMFVNGSGSITGARYIYADGETETVAKSIDRLQEGDQIQLIADYYTYSGDFQDAYKIGRPITVGSTLPTVSDKYFDNKANLRLTYRLTDIYNQQYWTDPIQ